MGAPAGTKGPGTRVDPKMDMMATHTSRTNTTMMNNTRMRRSKRTMATSTPRIDL